MRTFVLWLVLLVPALALPMTPDVLVNRKITLAEVGEKGRVYVDFDVRPLGAERVEIRLYRPGQRPEEDRPFRTWTFGSHGHERVDFNDLPRGIYRLVGVALGADGTPMAEPSRLVHIEYGGWRAWQTFLPPPNRDLRAAGPPFETVGVGESREIPGLLVIPSTLVLNPKEKGEIRAELVQPPVEDEEVEWELFGEGELETHGRTAVYKAPDETAGGNQIVQIRVRVKTRPNVKAQASVLLTDMKKEDLNKP